MSEQIISTQWLLEHLTDPDVAIADCRFALSDPQWGRTQYEQGHIPGSFYLDLNQDLSSPVGRHGGRHPLPDPEGLGAKLAAIGITFGKTWVIAYDDARFAFAARLWWLLRYLGHDRVAVLNGGFPAWLAAGYPVSTELPTATPGEFVPQVRTNWVVDREAVQARTQLPGVVLVDSRDGDRYSGKREPTDPIAGHIPGAVNYPWQDCTDAQGYLRSESEQGDRWKDLASASEILVYCGSGVTACVNLLSLELAGLSQGKLYAGSWSDWCSYLVDHPQ